MPDIPGLTAAPHVTSETVWQLERLPRHLVVLGGGPVGLELAQAFRRLGATVTLLTRGERLLPSADPDVSRALTTLVAAEGIDWRPGAIVRHLAPVQGGVELLLNGRALRGDTLLVATGRQPNVEGLTLDAAGARLGPRGIVVDRYLRTSQRHIYACGDVLGGPLFTHYAAWQGYYAVRNALLPGRSAAVRDRVPWTLFTDPEVAQVGLTEPEARGRFGEDTRTALLPLERVDRAQAEGACQGFIKVVQRANGELLGAHIVAARAGEMIHEYVLAMARGLRLKDLAAPIHVYPTYSTGAQQLAAARLVDDLLAGWRGRLARGLVRLGR